MDKLELEKAVFDFIEEVIISTNYMGLVKECNSQLEMDLTNTMYNMDVYDNVKLNYDKSAEYYKNIVYLFVNVMNTKVEFKLNINSELVYAIAHECKFLGKPIQRIDYLKDFRLTNASLDNLGIKLIGGDGYAFNDIILRACESDHIGRAYPKITSTFKEATMTMVVLYKLDPFDNVTSLEEYLLNHLLDDVVMTTEEMSIVLTHLYMLRLKRSLESKLQQLFNNSYQNVDLQKAFTDMIPTLEKPTIKYEGKMTNVEFHTNINRFINHGNYLNLDTIVSTLKIFCTSLCIDKYDYEGN